MMPRFISRFTEDVGTDRIAQKINRKIMIIFNEVSVSPS